MEPLYTICFGIDGGRILMLKRKKRPYPDHWTGLGGKIEPEETADLAVKREMQEESGYVGLRTEWFSYRGVACWLVSNDAGFRFGAMHVYVVELPGMATMVNDPQTREGEIAWKSVEWALDPQNSEVAPHVAAMLPEVLRSDGPQLYVMRFSNREFVGIEVMPWRQGTALPVVV